MEDSRRHAVTAYCREVCPEDLIAAAAAAALDAAAPARTDDEVLRAVRETAARFRRGPELPEDWERQLGQVREARATRAFTGATVGGLAEAPAPAATPTGGRPGMVVFPLTGDTAAAGSRRTPAGPRPAAARPPRRSQARARPFAGRLAEYRVFLTTLALGAMLVVVVALAVPAGGSAGPAAASLPPPSPAATPRAQIGVVTASRHRTHRARRHIVRPTSTSPGLTTTTTPTSTSTAPLTTTTSVPTTTTSVPTTTTSVPTTTTSVPTTTTSVPTATTSVPTATQTVGH